MPRSGSYFFRPAGDSDISFGFGERSYRIAK
jgi:hypothetical protein